ncbi:MAG: 30S ribosomal protein S2 [Rickettsiales bacterium]|nr:30S ribosomal protein S2 [Rickettsiales bacterium]
MRQLLECGVHFGHQTKRWNPKMKRYIFTARNGIHVIDLQQTLNLIKDAHSIIKNAVEKRGTILFVGTKKQAQEAIKDEAERCSMPYINHRWLGGTLTNFSTIRRSINKIKEFEQMQDEGTLQVLSNKEVSRKTKAYNKLTHNLNGIKNMIQTPSLLFVVDTKKEQLAIDEAKKLGIPIVGIVDTNANPLDITYPIPANDDAIRAVKLICSIIADAVLKGQENQISEEDLKAITEETFKKGSEEKEEAEKKEVKTKTEKKETPKKTAKVEKEVKVEKEKTPKKETKTEKKETPKKTVKAEKEVKEKKETVKKAKKTDEPKKSKTEKK